MKYVFLLVALMIPLMGAECSSPDGSHHETHAALQSPEVPAAPVPEPSSALIMAVGMVVAAFVMRGCK